MSLGCIKHIFQCVILHALLHHLPPPIVVKTMLWCLLCNAVDVSYYHSLISNGTQFVKLTNLVMPSHIFMSCFNTASVLLILYSLSCLMQFSLIFNGPPNHYVHCLGASKSPLTLDHVESRTLQVPYVSSQILAQFKHIYQIQHVRFYLNPLRNIKIQDQAWPLRA